MEPVLLDAAGRPPMSHRTSLLSGRLGAFLQYRFAGADS